MASRNNYGSINAERVPVVGFSGAGQRGDSRAMPDLADKVSSNIFQLNSERKSLEQWQKSLGTAKDSQELRNKIQNAETNINGIVTQTASDLSKLSSFARGSDKAMKLQYSKLTEDFKLCVELCSKSQKLALEKLRTTYLPSEVALMESTSPQGPNSYLQAGNTTAELRQATNALEFETGLLKEREQQIATIENNIIDIGQIMSELGALVNKQAEDINSIENATERTRDEVIMAQEELQKAVTYQTRRRKKNCIFLTILGVAFGVLILLIVISFH